MNNINAASLSTRRLLLLSGCPDAAAAAAVGLCIIPLCMIMDMNFIMSLAVLMQPIPRLGLEGPSCSSESRIEIEDRSNRGTAS